MDEQQLNEILNADAIPPADENARKQALNLALAEFDAVQQEKQTKKNRQGVALLRRLTGRSNTNSGERPMKKRYVFGGMATAMTVVLAVFVANEMRQSRMQMALKAPVSNKEEIKGGGKSAGRLSRGATSSESSIQSKSDLSGSYRAKNERQNRGDDFLPQQGTPSESTATKSENRSLPGAPALRGGRSGSIFEPNSRQGFGDRRSLQDAPRSPDAKGSSAVRRTTTMVPAANGQQPKSRLERNRRSNRTDQATGRTYQDVGRDKFAEVEQNTVKRVADNPVSTFSADVDTASYAFVRRQLNRGVMPQKSAVRVEELVNYFDYDYPQAANRARPFQPTVTVMPSPWRTGNKLIHIGIKGYDLDANEKPRSNLVFLLDVSGSMNAPDKLPLMVNSMKLLLNSLKPDDTVAIVVYAGAAGMVLDTTKVADKHKILSALERLRAGGSTAGAAGIRQAYALAEATFDKKAVNRVILATDGDFNVGITNRKELKDYVERKRNSGVFLSVLGFGQGNLNDHLMQTLAQNGNGVAAHIDTLNEARKVLVEEASSTLFPIAKDVKIQVEFNPSTVAEYRLIGYETRALKREDFNNDKVDAGDIGAGHKVTAIYEITPAGGTPLIGTLRYQKAEGSANSASAPDTANEFGFLKIRYKLPKSDTSTLMTTPITRSNELDGNREARWASAVAAFGQILKGGKYTGAYSYGDVIALARANKGEGAFGYRAEFINLVRLAESASTLPRK
jgi:Ca-activated chloride channel family protein